MFETMQGFLAFFITALSGVILGIIFEEKLVRIETALFGAIKKTFKERRNNNVF